MKLRNLIALKRDQGFQTLFAESLIGQEIIISAIKSSNLVDKTLVKGGVLMYNISKNARRASRDLDFDLIRYDISNEANIDALVLLFNKSTPDYSIKRVGKIEELRQEDYHGKRIYVEISDESYSFTIKIDIGIHTLFAIEQKEMEFNCSTIDGGIVLKVNPVEQVIGEKLYSLGKLGLVSTRYKDVYDIYYLINNYRLDKKKIVLCLEMLIKYGKSGINSIEDLIDSIDETFKNEYWLANFNSANADWLELKDNNQVLEELSKYIYSL